MTDWFAVFCTTHDPYKYAARALSDLKDAKDFDEHVSTSVERMWKCARKYNPARGSLPRFMWLLVNSKRFHWQRDYNRKIKKQGGKIYSLDYEINESGKTYGELLADSRVGDFSDAIIAKELWNTIYLLDDKRWQDIVISKMNGLSDQKIADKYHVSHQRIRQIYNKALKKIEKIYDSKKS